MRLSMPVAAGFCGLVTVSQAQAAFTLIDDFQSGSAGTPIASSNGWTAGDGGEGWTVVAEVGGNKYTARTTGGNAGIVFNNIADVAIGGKATLFFRAQSPTDIKLGLAGASASTTNMDADYAAGVAITGGGTAGNNLQTHAGSGPSSTTPLTPDTWYNVWIAFDNAAGAASYSVYYQLQGAAGSPALLGSRTTTATDITQIKLGAWAVRGGKFDDFYFDAQGLNLANPIPEPASLALVGLGLLAVAGRRRA